MKKQKQKQIFTLTIQPSEEQQAELNKFLKFRSETLRRLLVFLTLVTLLTTVISAHDFEVDNIYYNILSDGKSVSVTYKDVYYNSYSGIVNIPPSVENSGMTYFVTSIGNSAFSGCSGLTSVTIPNSVTKIGDMAFYKCSGLTSVTIPNSVTAIEGSAFDGCGGLTSIVVESGNKIYDSRDNCNAIVNTSNNELVVGCENTVIPNSVTSIGNYAFSGRSGLTSIDIPNSVTDIRYSAFSGCSGLTSVTIPDSVTTIYDYAFSNCSGLESVTIGNSVVDIQGFAFSGCSGLTSVTIPNSVSYYGRNVFENCSGLTSVEWNAKRCINPEYSFAYAPFKGLTGIKTFTFGNEVEIIPANLCLGLSGLTSVTIPNSVSRIDHGAFAACSGLTSVTIGNSVTVIGLHAFSDCSGLTSVIIPNSVSVIGGNAFAHCSGLTSVTIPNSVTAIEGSAFEGCSGLTSVTIPNSVTSINVDAFSYCSALTSVTIPNSVTTIRGNPFSFCSQLTSIVVESGNSTYDSRGNCNAIVNTSDNELVVGCKNTVIPNSVTSIGLWSFAGCSGLTSLTIPNSVTSIGTYAFYRCNCLTSVTIGNSVSEIGKCAFQFCSGLKSVTNMAETPQSIRPVDFDEVDISRCNLFVWHESIDKYKAASVWKDFIIQDLGGVDGVEADASEKEVEGYYDLQGIRHDESIRGQVNIVRYKDGTSQKVVVK